jgi:hypothetical protein
VPYNPNSAYPRKTTYIPPTYGDHSFRRAVNGVDFSSQNSFGGGPIRPRGGEIYQDMISAAAVSAVHPGAASGLAAAARKSPVTTKLSQTGQAGIATGVQAVANVAGPAIRAGVTGNVTPLLKKAGTAVVNRGINAVNNRRGGPIHGPVRPPMSHGNPAAMQTRAANTAMADQLGGMVLDGSLPGDTGQANIPKIILPSSMKRK